MKRYTRFAKLVNEGKLSPKNFVRMIFGENPDADEWQAAIWIYYEDGGTIPLDLFICEAPESPYPYTATQ
ncbi:MAG: hypothetical protein ACUVWN_04540 [bacterium]